MFTVELSDVSAWAGSICDRSVRTGASPAGAPVASTASSAMTSSFEPRPPLPGVYVLQTQTHPPPGRARAVLDQPSAHARSGPMRAARQIGVPVAAIDLQED